MAPGVTHSTRHVALPAPYDAKRLFAFLASRAIPGVEAVDTAGDGWRYRRAMRLPARLATGEIAVSGATAILTTTAPPQDAEQALDALGRVLDLDAPPSVVDEFFAAQPETHRLVAARPGLRVPRAADRPEVAFRALIGQQVSVAAASTTCGFIAAAYGEPLPASLADETITHAWPIAATLAAIDSAELRMPRAKATAAVTLAEALRDGAVTLDDPAAARRDLLALRGIGPWTAGYIAMRACGDHDVLLDGDLIVRRGAGLIGLPDEPRALREAAQRFAPWRSYLTMHLWQAYAAAQ